MSKSKSSSAAQRPAFFTPTQMDWTDERLAQLDKEQLLNLLGNLATQRASGRVGEATATELETRIRARLPARATAVRRKRARSEVLLEARVAQELGALAAELATRFGLGHDPAGAVRAPGAAAPVAVGAARAGRMTALVDSKGHARTGHSVKTGAAAIERYIASRTQDSLAGLAYILLPDSPHTSGRYVLLATEDLLDEAVADNEYTPLAQQHAWSAAARARLRALPMPNLAEAAQRYESLLQRATGAVAAVG
jgi:hypothetical protein